MPTPNSAAADDLYKASRARNKAPNDQLTQDLIGPEEHRQAVEEMTADNPVAGAAATALAVPYAVAKKTGLRFDQAFGGNQEKTSEGSMHEVIAAGKGFVAGMKRFTSR